MGKKVIRCEKLNNKPIFENECPDKTCVRCKSKSQRLNSSSNSSESKKRKIRFEVSQKDNEQESAFVKAFLNRTKPVLFDKLKRRVLGTRRVRTIQAGITQLTRKLCDESPQIAKWIGAFPSGENFDEIISSIVSLMLRLHNCSFDGLPKSLRELYGILTIFSKYYGLRVIMLKNVREELEYAFSVCSFIDPSHDLFMISDGKTEYIEDWGINSRKKNLIKRSVALGVHFNEVEIKAQEADFPKRDPIVMGLATTSCIIPTVIKFEDKGQGERRLFVSLPEFLDVTTFLKEYRVALSKTHKDFFGRKFNVRPGSRNDQIKRLKMFAQELTRGKKISKNRLSALIAEKAGISPKTVMRHYKKQVMK